MAPAGASRRRQAADLRSHVSCAPAFAARPLQAGPPLQLACLPYMPRHRQRPADGPTPEELHALPPAVAALLTAPEWPAGAADHTAGAAAAAAPSGSAAQHAPAAAAAAASASLPASERDTGSRPAKRVRRCAGPQPLPPHRLPDPAAARLLLQAACAPFDIGLEPALQLLAPALRPLPPPCCPCLAGPAAAASPADQHAAAAINSKCSGRYDHSSGSEPAAVSSNRTPQNPRPPPLLPVFAHPGSAAPTPEQAAVLRACIVADQGAAPPAGAVLIARPLPQPAVLAGYQEDWLELAPTALSAWEKVGFCPVLKYVLAYVFM